MMQDLPKTIRMIEKMDEMMDKEKKQIFGCQCGKKYETFPALYLHFQRIHKIKISTKVSKEPCEVNEDESSRTYTYLFSESFTITKSQTDGLQNLGQEKNYLEGILQEFQEESTLEFGFCPLKAWISNQLKNFVMSKKQSSGETIDYKLIQELPFTFNDFVMGIQKQLRKKGVYAQACEILLSFGKWLNKKQYSKYIIEPFSPNQF